MSAVPIAATFTKDNWIYELVERRGDCAIFSQRRANYVRAFHWEVVRLRTRPAETKITRGVRYDYPERETMPESESWGTDGFTERSIESAYKRLENLSRQAVSIPQHQIPGTGQTCPPLGHPPQRSNDQNGSNPGFGQSL